jgi:hypothetical protein
MFKFRLYVATGTLNSTQAVANLNALCRAHLEGRHEIEVVDVFREPQKPWDWIPSLRDPSPRLALPIRNRRTSRPQPSGEAACRTPF